MNFLVDIAEDLNYYQLTLEKQAFLDMKNIPVVYKGAKLAFVNSKDRLVFYRKQPKQKESN